MDYIQRHIEFQHLIGNKTFQEGEIIFREYNQIIIPLGPVIQKKPDVFPDLRRVLKNLRGKLVWWSYSDENAKDDGWYAVIKTKHFEVEQYPSSNVRNQIRKGLKNCEVRQIEATWLAQNGYPVYRAAIGKYSTKNPKPKESNLFKKKISVAGSFSDIIQYWGIFNNNRLIGFAEIYLYGNQEANISQIKVDPQYNSLYPVYGLIHELSLYYIDKQAISYLSDGYRTLLHDSGIQDFLIRKFGFVKSKQRLFIEKGVVARAIVKFTNNQIIRKQFTSLNALIKLIELQHNY